MASSNKTTTPTGPRRKSTKQSQIITLKLSPKLLRQFGPPAPVVVKEESPLKESPSSSTSATIPVATSSNGDNKSDSNANTPVPNNAAPSSTLMPPPTEGPKKKAPKRSAASALGPDGLPKPRGKPGPKKKARLEDGSIDHSTTTPRAANGTAAHKLGPKANQGAINAGLRALDRTGKPCRKWQKGGFRLKSFTGVVWEIPRWTAPPRITVELKTSTEGSASGSGDSSKENKDNSQVESEKSNNGIDVEMASSPAPQVASSATPPVTSVPAASTPPVTGPAPVITASA
ncbi:INO80 complex subunit [Lachnellula occidentalis]|uniref:INO80 complex subunit n=1 Tax=Lachnellula occidentalis TaxID=215460 RepID=A0A8H8S5Q3_9HELO|nr:INO80 complex subunit [Lachnellula occidentalis]